MLISGNGYVAMIITQEHWLCAMYDIVMWDRWIDFLQEVMV